MIQDRTHPIFNRTENLSLLKTLLSKSQKVICQPIKNDKNEFFKLPVNHDGGDVLCVTEFDYVKNQNPYTCLNCKQKYQQSQIYYDSTLEFYIRQIIDSKTWGNAQSIIFNLDGSWEPSKDTYQEFIKFQQQNSQSLQGVDLFFSDINNAIDEKYQQKNKGNDVQVQIKPKGISEIVNIIKQQIKLNPYNDDMTLNETMKNKLKTIFFSRVRVSFNNNLSDVELFITGLQKYFYAKLAVLQDDGINYSTIELHENSRIFMGHDTYVIIGGQKGCFSDLGLKDVYAGKVLDIIKNFDYGNSQTKYIPLKTVASLKYPRDQFQICENDGYLYVIGGYIRKETFDNGFLKPDPQQIKTIQNDQQMSKKENPNAIPQVVKWIERIKLDEIETAQWEPVTQLQIGTFQCGCAIQNNRIIVVGGVTIDYSSYSCRKGVKHLQTFDLLKKQWLAPFEYLQKDNVLMYVIAPVNDNQNVLILGGQGYYEDSRWKNDNNKYVELYTPEGLAGRRVPKPQLDKSLDRLNINNWDLFSRKLQAQILDEVNQRQGKKYTAAVIKPLSLQEKQEQGKTITQFVFFDSAKEVFTTSELF